MGAKSSAVPTTNTTAMITSISRRGSSSRGDSTEAICCGTSETVMSHAEASDAAIRKTTTAVVRTAETRIG